MEDELLGRARCEAIFSEVADCARAHGVQEIEAIVAGSENARCGMIALGKTHCDVDVQFGM